MADRVLLRASDIAAMDGVAKAHFLDGGARRVNRSLGDATGLTGIGVHLIEVAPGDASTELHVHHHEDEAVYVLSGTARAHVGDDVFDVGPGDFLGHAAGGAPHMLVATGEAPLRCLVVGARLAHDVTDYPRAGKRLFRNRGLPWQVAAFDALTDPKA